MGIFIYRITNKQNNKSYIGITKNFSRRMKEHQNSDANYPVQKALKKYGKDNFDFIVLEKTPTWKIACEKEKKYIVMLQTKSPFGYNLTDGGDGNSELCAWNKGLDWCSEEIKEQISDTLKKYYQNNDNPFKGKHHSEDSKKKMSESCKKAMTNKRKKQISERQIRKPGLRKGILHTEEVKRKISESCKNRLVWNKGIICPQLTKENNGFYGRHHTDETKEKIAFIHKGNTYNVGRKFSDEHRKKLSESHKGLQNHLGFKHSEETKKKISQTKLRRANYDHI